MSPSDPQHAAPVGTLWIALPDGYSWAQAHLRGLGLAVSVSRYATPGATRTLRRGLPARFADAAGTRRRAIADRRRSPTPAEVEQVVRYDDRATFSALIAERPVTFGVHPGVAYQWLTSEDYRVGGLSRWTVLVDLGVGVLDVDLASTGDLDAVMGRVASALRIEDDASPAGSDVFQAGPIALTAAGSRADVEFRASVGVLRVETSGGDRPGSVELRRERWAELQAYRGADESVRDVRNAPRTVAGWLGGELVTVADRREFSWERVGPALGVSITWTGTDGRLHDDVAVWDRLLDSARRRPDPVPVRDGAVRVGAATVDPPSSFALLYASARVGRTTVTSTPWGPLDRDERDAAVAAQQERELRTGEPGKAPPEPLAVRGLDARAVLRAARAPSTTGSATVFVATQHALVKARVYGQSPPADLLAQAVDALDALRLPGDPGFGDRPWLYLGPVALALDAQEGDTVDAALEGPDGTLSIRWAEGEGLATMPSHVGERPEPPPAPPMPPPPPGSRIPPPPPALRTVESLRTGARPAGGQPGRELVTEVSSLGLRLQRVHEWLSDPGFGSRVALALAVPPESERAESLRLWDDLLASLRT